jgi:uncharacterized protein (TIGR00251 family)
MLDLKEKDGAVTLRIRVQPRARRNEIIGEHAGALKLKIAAPPVDGKANEECRHFLARLLAVNARSIEIVTGESSREKIVRIHSTDSRRVAAALSVPLANEPVVAKKEG